MVNEGGQWVGDFGLLEAIETLLRLTHGVIGRVGAPSVPPKGWVDARGHLADNGFGCPGAGLLIRESRQRSCLCLRCRDDRSYATKSLLALGRGWGGRRDGGGVGAQSEEDEEGGAKRSRRGCNRMRVPSWSGPEKAMPIRKAATAAET